MTKLKPVCKTCIAEWAETGNDPAAMPIRPAPYVGPRCATHHREAKRAKAAKGHDARVQRVYNLPPGMYEQILAFQGGKCAICQRATGRTKRLAVDHDHSCCPGPTSCGKCVRGLLCSTDNQLLGHGRDSVEFFKQCIDYLKDPPARKVFRNDQDAE